MLDVDTFLTTLYVMVDDFCQSRPPKTRPVPMHPSPKVRSLPSPSSPGGPDSPASGTSTATPRPPPRSVPHPARSLAVQPLVRSHTELIEEMALHLAAHGGERQCPYEALDSSAMPVRDAKRRGNGWLAG